MRKLSDPWRNTTSKEEKPATTQWVGSMYFWSATTSIGMKRLLLKDSITFDQFKADFVKEYQELLNGTGEFITIPFTNGEVQSIRRSTLVESGVRFSEE